ncbi:ATP-binding protein [Sinorhizobium americanum]|uniref:Adenylate/guanylate cyclase family protein n=1 Tax=Sinorhizobium americanum TaxID=194963 RepID=A0A4R2BRX4_9HYPH|nr:AAA family ATPase [Sinorhizobium americanum]TCN30186.1 adenylate/guanylate cyclase family protein [Sinorhizobium americanum]
MKSLDARLRLAGERRQVTALFYDIVGSTEIFVRSDPEHFFRSVTALHQTAATIVGRHGGFLHRRLGDGGCSYFGYPEPSEDAAGSAVEAALELIGTATTRSRRPGEPFKLRIGIATSLVVFSSEKDEIVGTAPILASRLQAEAEPNSVIVADSTFQLTRAKFDYSLIGEAKLKGFNESITLWRPEPKRHVQGPASISRSPGLVMRGREKELAALIDTWKAARDGNGGSHAIIGEAGIGKSRLVSELRRSIDGGGLTFQCNKRLEGQPFHPFIGFLETIVDSRVLKSGDGRRLREALRTAGMDVDADVAEIISAFTAERSRAMSANIRATDLTGRAFRRQVVDASVRLLCCGASAGPTLIVFEDVHWADDMTLELLDSLCARAVTLPILVIQTSRVARAEAVATQMELTGLPPAAIRGLIASVWDGSPPIGLSDFITAQCDGMPLYAEELAHFFRARHVGRQPVSEWKELLLEGGVSSLNDLLSMKLAGAGSARRVAQFASVIGREFTIGLLANLLGKEGRQALGEHLGMLAAHGIIEPAPGQTDTYQFRHILLQEAAYSSLLKGDRRRIHERIATLLIEERVPPLPDAIAAWQCAEAGRHGEAAKFALMGAEACVLRSAMKEATLSLDLCTRELAMVSRRHPRHRELTLNMLQLQGVVVAALDGEGSERARRIYSRAMKLLRRQETATREAHFPTYWGWWFTAPNIRTQQSRARVLVEDMMAVNDPETRLQSYHCAWATSFHAGEHGFCLDCVRKGLELYDAERAVRNRAFFGGHDARVCGLGESALAYLILDRPDASEDSINQCLEYAGLTDHAGSLVHALYYASVLRCCQGRHEDVHTLGEQMLSLAERHDLVASQARANMYCGWAELMTSSPGSGARRFQEGLSLQQQSGTDDNLSIHSDMHSQVLQRIGRHVEALSVIDNAIAVGRKSGQLFWLPELYRRRAGVRQELGDKSHRIRSDLARAIRIADAQGAGWLLERAKRDWERLLHD